MLLSTDDFMPFESDSKFGRQFVSNFKDEARENGETIHYLGDGPEGSMYGFTRGWAPPPPSLGRLGTRSIKKTLQEPFVTAPTLHKSIFFYIYFLEYTLHASVNACLGARESCAVWRSSGEDATSEASASTQNHSVRIGSDRGALQRATRHFRRRGTSWLHDTFRSG